MRDVQIVRHAALWIFGVLYDVDDVEGVLTGVIRARTPSPAPQRKKAFDMAIDGECGIIRVGEQDYYASELLFATDYAAYADLGERLCGAFDVEEAKAPEGVEQ